MTCRTTIQRRTRDDLLSLLAPLPWVRLAHTPTPLEEAPRLRAVLGQGAPRILIKRDDLTGLALGGNKVRHLEFRLGDIREKGADTLIVTNVAQSNHARLHTALAAKHGLTSYVVKIPSPRDEPINGNLLLDHLMGANIIDAPSADPADIALALQNLVATLESEGRVVYSVPTDTFSKIAGAFAYLKAAVELLSQLDEIGARADHIVLASGTSSAGLALAGKLLGESYRVHAISVGGSRAEIEAYILHAANGAAEHLGISERITTQDVVVHDEFVGERYGVPTEKGLAAMRLAARTEALILDPVYTSKAMSALVDLTARGTFTADDTVVFVHTGGLPITFAYSSEILASLNQS